MHLINITNQNFFDDFLKIITEELNVKGIINDIIEAYLNYKKKRFEIFEKEYEIQFKDSRDEDEEEKIYNNESISQLPPHLLIKQLGLNDLIWSYDGNSLYPSAMLDEKPIYDRIETGYAYTEDMNDELVRKFNTGNFIQGSAILKIKYYNSKNLIVQHLPVKRKKKKLKLIACESVIS